MVPITEIYLDDLGPNPVEVLRMVDSVLRCGYLAIVRRLRDGPILVASGESLELAGAVRALQEAGASVRWEAQADPDWDATRK
jgi:hypothetical protein